MNNLAYKLKPEPITTTTIEITKRFKSFRNHTSTLKHTSKGLRIWIENASFLNDCGFSVGQRYDRDYKDGFIVLTLNHPIGKYKVSNGSRNGKQRPIIDIVGKKISNSIDPVKYSLIKASLFSNTIDKVIIIEGVQSW